MSTITTSPVPQPITVYQNRTKLLEIKVKLRGVVQNLTGSVIHFTVRATPGGTILINLDSGAQPAQIFILTPQTDADKKGKLQIIILDTDISNLPDFGDFCYDVAVVIGTNKHPVVIPSVLHYEESITTDA